MLSFRPRFCPRKFFVNTQKTAWLCGFLGLQCPRCRSSFCSRCPHIFEAETQKPAYNAVFRDFFVRP